ncbi:sterol o-acyltransferase [Ceraceosorus bombacis]|uniref:Sterol o-acyltransferase n=1 Tax=Ceraceosorus bombacis TaxID=401625 RepID=A0A0P1BJ50_9BASI|nr:sterol o-acyltransferase [Ceraceosorus bombacis]
MSTLGNKLRNRLSGSHRRASRTGLTPEPDTKENIQPLTPSHSQSQSQADGDKASVKVPKVLVNGSSASETLESTNTHTSAETAARPELQDRSDSTISAAASAATASTISTGEPPAEISTTVTTEVVRPGTQAGEADAVKEERLSQSHTTQVTHLNASDVKHEVGKDGSIVLKPQEAASSRNKKRGKKIRALVTFVPRESKFDRYNAESAGDPFRGFYVLFWISLFLLMLDTFYTSWASTGQFISLAFATLFSKDAGVLVLSDAALVGSTFICVPFAIMLKRGWFSYWPSLIWLQHAWQSVLLGGVIKWTQYRDWPWVQSGFMTLHTLSMMMKVHSYCAVNGAMADSFCKMRRVERQLEERVAEIAKDAAPHESTRISQEAWNVALSEASKYQAGTNGSGANGIKAERVEDSAATSASLSAADENVWASLEAQRGSSRLRHRNNASVLKRRTTSGPTSPGPHSSQAPVGTKGGAAGDTTTVRDPHPLAFHPDPVVSKLAKDIEELREELLSSDPDESGEHVSWPQNVTFRNFFDYLCCPTLVYELSYPRVKTIRPSYLLEKALAGVGTFCVIYVITEHWIMPHQPAAGTSLAKTFFALAVPMLVNYLLIFFVMFECALAFAGEATRFADREFYLDWWNSRSMDEFSRKWNKPVHTFLLRHVYAHSITAGVSKQLALFLTFLLSALLHELVMAIVSGKIRGYLFAMQMAQIPLIAISQIPWVKQRPTLGNAFFWISLAIGFQRECIC